jgi:uracil phosphoribosyltransferase
LQTKGEPVHIHLASIIASKQAVEYIHEIMPHDRATLWLAAIDDDLNDHSYIVPGLGDAGDLSYGEKED